MTITTTARLVLGQETRDSNVLDGAGVDGAQLGLVIGLALIALAVLGAVLLIVAALVQVAQAVHLSEPSRTRWVLTVVLAPIFGALAWFAVGNRLQTS